MNQNSVPRWLIVLMIASLIVLVTICLYLLYRLLPITDNDRIVLWCSDWVSKKLNWANPCIDIHAHTDSKMILLVVIAGMLGAFVHAASSFTIYLGAKQFRTNWVWWYLLRPFIGAAIAVLVYIVFRGGLFTSSSSGSFPESINVYGILALSGLAGMFSKKCSKWLENIFDNVFKSKDEPEDKIESVRHDSQLVKNEMIKKSEIDYFSIQEGQELTDILLNRLNTILEEKARNRILIMNHLDLPKYVIHKSAIDNFLLKKSKEFAEQDKTTSEPRVNQLTLKDFLGNEPENSPYSFGKGFTCVKEDATLTQAKTAMNQLDSCRDVIVTKNGTPNEAVLGWITNVILAQKTK